MNKPDLQEALLPYLRTWKRHKIFFGLESGRRWLKHIGKVLPAAYCSLSADWKAEENLPTLSLKVVSESLFYRFPYNYADVSKRGTLNSSFLDSRTLLKEHVFAVLNNQLVTAQHVVFPIPRISKTERLTCSALLKKLELFLDSLPQSYRYAVQVGNPEYLTPAFFDSLRTRGIVHVISDHAGIPTILDQIQSPYIFTAESLIVLTNANAEWQAGIIETVRRCVRERKQLFCYLNDTGNVDLLRELLAFMEGMDGDLAKLSFIKRQHAA